MALKTERINEWIIYNADCLQPIWKRDLDDKVTKKGTWLYAFSLNGNVEW